MHYALGYAWDLLKRLVLGLLRRFLTARVLLRDTHGHERLRVCNHAFIYSNGVFNPSNSGTRIGEIDERWEALDVALVKLNPAISYTNQMCFEAKGKKERIDRSRLGTSLSSRLGPIDFAN